MMTTMQCMMLPIASCHGSGTLKEKVPTNKFGCLDASARHNRSSHIKERQIHAVKIIAKRAPIKKQKQRESPVETCRLRQTDLDKLNREAEPMQSGFGDQRLDSATSTSGNDRESIGMVDNVNTRTSSGLVLDSKREAVLKACFVTCGCISAAGVLIQQASHWAAEAGWSVSDSSVLIAYHIEPWHLGVTMGLVVTVSAFRQLLLRVWPDFSESSHLANQEVLGPLELVDYMIVAILPGISEELLFRGALLPFFGADWKGATLTGILFGVLHLNGGRKAAFAIWASIVGILYGLACVSTHTVLVPMAAHSVNNLVGAILWKLNEADQSFDQDQDQT